MTTSEINICAERVRMYDNDRFLSVLFAPAACRDALLALYAFNLELSKIRETVSEPLIGRMRLQFWRDAMEGIAAGSPPAHEVARPLSDAVRAHDLQIRDFMEIIDCRETDLDELPPSGIENLKKYAAGTAGVLTRLSIKILGADPDRFRNVVDAAGIAIAFVGLARAIPHQAASGRVTLPSDLCRVAGLDPSIPSQWPDNADYRPITKPLLDVAEEKLEMVRDDARSMPRSLIPAMLPVSLSRLYLRGLRRHDNDPVAYLAAQPGMSRQLTVLWHAMRGRP